MPTELTLRVIGEDPDEGVVESFTFYSGEIRTLNLQLFNLTSEEKRVLPAGAINSLILSATPSDLVFADGVITVSSTDRSIVSVSLSAANTAAMISGAAKFSYSLAGPPAVNRIAYGEYVLKRLVTQME